MVKLLKPKIGKPPEDGLFNSYNDICRPIVTEEHGNYAIQFSPADQYDSNGIKRTQEPEDLPIPVLFSPTDDFQNKYDEENMKHDIKNPVGNIFMEKEQKKA
jgi:hypothetical protein